MTLDDKIFDYLDRENGYRTVQEITRAVGTTEVRVGKLCDKLYWNVNNGMQRSVLRPEPGHPGKMVLYATKYDDCWENSLE